MPSGAYTKSNIKKMDCHIIMAFKRRKRVKDFKNDIKGCNEKMLIQHLNSLLKEGFVGKLEYDVYPKKTEYYLTEKGEALLPVLRLMQEYGREYLV